MIIPQGQVGIVRGMGKRPPPPRVNPYAQFLTPKVEVKPKNERLYTETQVRQMFAKLAASLDANKTEIATQIVANGKRQLELEVQKFIADADRHLESLQKEEQRLESIRSNTRTILTKATQAAPEQVKQLEAALKRVQSQLLIANKIREFLESHVDLTDVFPSIRFAKQMSKELLQWSSAIEEKSDRLRDATKVGRVITQTEITTLLSTIDPLIFAISEYASQIRDYVEEAEHGESNKAA